MTRRSRLWTRWHSVGDWSAWGVCLCRENGVRPSLVVFRFSVAVWGGGGGGGAVRGAVKFCLAPRSACGSLEWEEKTRVKIGLYYFHPRSLFIFIDKFVWLSG